MPVTIYRSAGDPYEHVLADLRRRRDELDTAIRAVEAVRGVSSVAAPQSGGSTLDDTRPVPQAGSVYSGVSIAEAAKMVLITNGGPMRTSEIVPLIQAGGVNLKSADPNNTTNSILSRRANSVGDIVRIGRSAWDLRERAAASAQASAPPPPRTRRLIPDDVEAAPSNQESAAS